MYGHVILHEYYAYTCKTYAHVHVYIYMCVYCMYEMMYMYVVCLQSGLQLW